METQTVVLLGKEHDITAFASNDPSRYVIQSVHYNEKAQCLEAVNGRCLIRVPVEKSEDFPTLSGTFQPATDSIIPIAPFKKALAGMPNGGSLPILKHVALSGSDDERVRMTTNDLDNENSVVAKRIEGNYPNTEQVIPTATPTFSISISAVELQIIANYFAKHGDAQHAINFQFTADCEAVRFSGKLESGKKATGVVMPMRMS